jgi:FG-GAP-like repeat
LACMDFAIAALAIAQSADVGLTFAQGPDVDVSGGTVSFDVQGQTAQFEATADNQSVNGPRVGPLAISVTSTLPMDISASSAVHQNWLQIALSSDGMSCPDITMETYLTSIPVHFAGKTVLCVLATEMPKYSIYEGLLSFQTQEGTASIPVTYTVNPGKYLQVSIGTHDVGGKTLTYSGKQILDFQITARSNGVTGVPLDAGVDIVLTRKVDGLTLSTNTLPSLPGSLEITLDRAPPGAFTTVQLQGTDGLGELDFGIRIVPSAFPAVWRPGNVGWYLVPPTRPSGLDRQFGLPTDTPVPADYDGDGQIDFAVWRASEGNWYVRRSGDDLDAPPVQWGLAGDIPVPADYDGDGKVDFAVWRKGNGTWYISPSNGAGYIVQWGLASDIPVPADYDGDGKADLAVWRPSEANWYILPSKPPGARIVRQWGLSNDKPVPADYDGDGKADLAVWRPSEANWYILPSKPPGAPIVQQWGFPDTPVREDNDNLVPADYDGDGKADLAVWRPTEGKWYILPSGGKPGVQIVPWGLMGDVPLTKAPLEVSPQ